MAGLELRSIVRATWAAHLGNDRFADDDSFLSIGGDSLLAARVMAQISRSLGRRLRVGVLLRNPTVSNLCAAIQAIPGVPNGQGTGEQDGVRQHAGATGPGLAGQPDRRSPAVPARADASDARSATIHRLVLDAARTYRGRQALVSTRDGRSIDYATVEATSGRVARWLVHRGAGPGDFVGLLSGHTPEAVLGLLGVLRAGAAYLPLDPAWPRRRLEALMGRYDIRFLLAGADELRRIDEVGWTSSLRDVLCLELADDRNWQRELDREAVEDLWDFVAQSDDRVMAAGFNSRPEDHVFSGADVDAYVDRVIEIVRSVHPHGRVLEIGCGSGEVLRRLAPAAARYAALDPSSVAVQRNRAWTRASGLAVDIRKGFADQAADLFDGPFDVVLLASTAQFFVGAAYLLDVLDAVAPMLAADGAVVIADMIDPDAEEHSGLRLPRSFFSNLAGPGGVWSSAQVRDRAPRSLAGPLDARYDVVLGRGPAPPGQLRRRRYWTAAALDAVSPDVAIDQASADDLAYVIFTSGSTGEPKGVAVAHRSVVSLIEWVNQRQAVGAEDRLLFVTSFAFDLSVYDMFGSLAVGATLLIAPDDDLAEPSAVAELLIGEEVTFWDSAPAALSAVLPFVPLVSYGRRDRLRLVFLSGDWVPLTLPDEVRTAFPQAGVVALGGATECTIWSNDFPVGTVAPDWPSIPYGKPMTGARYYVLDEHLDERPVGEPGDLYIAGSCLALGYLGDPALTAAKFIPDVATGEAGGRMYRTGDRARWLADGNLQFLGRSDDQVKVRGYRIELAEVQAAIGRCPGVREAVVAAPPGESGPELVAFFVPALPGAATAEQVRAALAETLPPWMVPGRLISVPEFPRSATGKVSRDLLLREYRADAAAAVIAAQDAP